MEEGSFDLKGLAEHAVRYGVSKVGLAVMSEDLIPFVGLGMTALQIPEMVKLDPFTTLLGKLVVNGVMRQRAYDNRQREQPASKSE